jgi:hypothetical protein
MAARMKAQVREYTVDHMPIVPIVTAPAAILDVLREAIAVVSAESMA